MSDAANDPEIVHVWVCRVTGTSEAVGVRATRDAAEQWVEDRVDDDARWVEGPGVKDIYRGGADATKGGMVSMCPVPDCLGLVIPQ
jgi:hypothetical protein